MIWRCDTCGTAVEVEERKAAQMSSIPCPAVFRKPAKPGARRRGKVVHRCSFITRSLERGPDGLPVALHLGVAGGRLVPAGGVAGLEGEGNEEGSV